MMARQRDVLATVEARLRAQPPMDLDPAKLTADHPLARAIGLEAARLALDPPSHRVARRAEERREAVKRLSLAGRKVRDIASELGIHPAYVVQLRAQLGVGRRR